MNRTAGWYPDPKDSERDRWWDGETWTEQVRAAPRTGPARGGGRSPWRVVLTLVTGAALAVASLFVLFIVLVAIAFSQWNGQWSNK